MHSVEQHIADVATHNGYITIENPKTGKHETYHAHTHPKTKQRILSIVCQYRAKSRFARIDELGQIHLLPKYQHSIYEGYKKRALLLAHPECGVMHHGLHYHIEGKCRRCNAKLTHPDSIRLGIGPICRAHLALDQLLAYFKTMSDAVLVGHWRSLIAQAKADHTFYEHARIAWSCIQNPDLKASLRMER